MPREKITFYEESFEESRNTKFEMVQELLYWLLIFTAIFIVTIGFIYLVAAVVLNIIFDALRDALRVLLFFPKKEKLKKPFFNIATGVWAGFGRFLSRNIFRN